MLFLLRTAARLLVKILAVFLLVSCLLVLLLKWIDPPTTSFILQGQVKALFASAADRRPEPPLRYQWVSYRQISPYMPLAAVASEDQKFPFHKGFDLAAIEKAVKQNREGKRVRGASTISQQVAKNLFLWPGRSYLRKGLEAYFTFLIEMLWSKQRILEMYVNVAQMGDNIYGVGAASRQFFNKSAGALRPEEAALLAAVLPSPARLRADAPSGYVLQRRQKILNQMNSLGGTRYLARL